MTNNTSRLQQWLETIWYEGGRGKYLLFPLMGVYCSINYLQRVIQHRKIPLTSCPVIVVGNITVGGTGKTPLTIYLVKLLQQAGYRPAIITRGYGGKAKQWPQFVNAKSDAQQVGDEAVLMAIRTGVPVYAGANRQASIKACLKQHDCNVILSDDGLQHYKMPRDMQIAVIDAQRQLGNGWCLPAGPLREPLSRLRQCDFIVMNGSGFISALTTGKAHHMAVKEGQVVNLKTAQQKKLADFKGQMINAVTGIGNPQRFYRMLEQNGLVLHKHGYPDHYLFQPEDLNFGNDFAILMTEKDAVKCKGFAKENCWYLSIESQLEQDFDKDFLAFLSSVIQQHKNLLDNNPKL